MATPETLAKELNLTPQVLRRKLRALGLGHAKGQRWSWDDGSAELASLKEQLKSTPEPKPAKSTKKATKKPATKKPAKKTTKKPAKKAIPEAKS